jgi:hypothetical protein
MMACVALAGWWPRLFDPEAIAAAAIAPQWRAELGRERMLESVPHVGHWPWSDEAAAGKGDVVWDNERQQGFLLLRGVAANDPKLVRYQLWIFDAARDERYPVNGGLFDVPAGREFVVVPVRPGVRVSHPAAFAVTVERPDGAVVSAREQVVAIAHTGR